MHSWVSYILNEYILCYQESSHKSNRKWTKVLTRRLNTIVSSYFFFFGGVSIVFINWLYSLSPKNRGMENWLRHFFSVFMYSLCCRLKIVFFIYFFAVNPFDANKPIDLPTDEYKVNKCLLVLYLVKEDEEKYKNRLFFLILYYTSFSCTYIFISSQHRKIVVVIDGCQRYPRA